MGGPNGPSPSIGYSVGQVAELAGVTVRALHHYDEIGLLAPSGRTAAGYRVYGEADLERLQQVLFYRELGLPLDAIAGLLADPAARAPDHLRRQHRLLTDRITRLQAMVTAVERAMEATTMGISLTPEERFELFGDFVPEDYAEEAEQRWGDTEAWRESQRRTSRYTVEQWRAIKAESDEFEGALAAAAASGVAPDSEAAMDLAERQRQHLSRWFYDCSPEMHRGLGQLYVDDERFAAYYERRRIGLAAYLRNAIAANAERPAAGAIG